MDAVQHLFMAILEDSLSISETLPVFSLVIRHASGFKTEHMHKITLLQFLLMTMKTNECTFATSLKFQNSKPGRREATTALLKGVDPQ